MPDLEEEILQVSKLSISESRIPQLTLLTLPIELQEMIVKCLMPSMDQRIVWSPKIPKSTSATPPPRAAAMNLSLTCHSFYNLVTPHIRDLERDPYCQYYNFFTCSEFLLLLPESKFAWNMVTGRHGKNGKYGGSRFCMDCGVDKYEAGKMPRYRRGYYLQKDKIICIACKRPKTWVGNRWVDGYRAGLLLMESVIRTSKHCSECKEGIFKSTQDNLSLWEFQNIIKGMEERYKNEKEARLEQWRKERKVIMERSGELDKAEVAKKRAQRRAEKKKGSKTN